MYNTLCYSINCLLIYTKTDWDSIENRRKFFERYAQTRGFNAKDAQHWATIPKRVLMELPVCISQSLLFFVSYQVPLC